MSFHINDAPHTARKLAILSRDAQYDLACACASKPEERRKRAPDQRWIYPVTLPNGGTTFLFKTLLSNACSNDCAYCPLRSGLDKTERCALAPEEAARAFWSSYRAGQVQGLFLTSGVGASPDATMDRINGTASLLRRQGFRGYMHLKIIPGASDAAIRHTLSLASAVSLNIETAGEDNFRLLSRKKDYKRDILRPIQLISALTAHGAHFSGVRHTTQFVIGASKETDRSIVHYSWKLYKELRLGRVYFSAYQRGAGDPSLPGENSGAEGKDILTREHRLYQVDWLIRKYGFQEDEIPFDTAGQLSLETDPKEAWARRHPEFFPVNVNRAERWQLLRVPGLGEVVASRILALRAKGSRLRSLDDFKRLGRVSTKMAAWVTFS